MRVNDGDARPLLVRLGAHLPEGPFEQGVQLLQAQAGRLGHGDEDVDERDEAPAGEEEEGAPVVHAGQHRRGALVDAEVEEPVEGLRQGAAEGADVVGPQLGAEDVGQDEEAWEVRQCLRRFPRAGHETYPLRSRSRGCRWRRWRPRKSPAPRRRLACA